MSNLVHRFLTEESGATAIEYGLIAAILCLALVGALTTLQGKLSSTFSAVGSALP